ncbi:hypothetical protein GGTG_09040 [Gaeumannomyces tritici R3-111a-1]|uniref:Steroid 5-alpha reductase C-terminal domain-containing protein n=1 Tax=Gaeumannomyces tritici (strain R3-111a-1) TaxID=644352 RepID=J3P699_GAET3|nr:hypothetical protein GGTG_09040 [Gaeumannomyces tritici R3-111a-1]EJT72173.1 hypothetical protein GGTG_09040 [Gaeumannomyces tritici R3-111a-1]
MAKPSSSSSSKRSSKSSASASGSGDGAAAPADRQPFELIRRGVKKPSPAGTALFIALRALDVPLQYQLVSGAWSVPLLGRLGLAAARPVVTTVAHTGVAAIDRLRLSRPGLVLLVMAAGSAAKHALWVGFISLEEFRPPAAAVVAGFNSFFNSVNSLLLVAAVTSTSVSGPFVPVNHPKLGGKFYVPVQLAVGLGLYVVGMGLELVSEVQRRRFKSKPENKGRICRKGLWGVARHINYTGYALWRTGFTLAAGGWIPGAVAALFNAWSFVARSTPELEAYMSRKYRDSWSKYKRDVKWLLLPGIY